MLTIIHGKYMKDTCQNETVTAVERNNDEEGKAKYVG